MKKNILSLIAGASLTLAFSPFSFFPIAIISPAVLFVCWLNISPKQAFMRGLLFGLGFFGTSVSWVFISIHHFGNAPIWLAGLITFLFVTILALFPASTGALLNRFFPILNITKLLCAFPFVWVTLEWIRSWILTGFPWALLGYSQINSPLKGYGPLLGVYGISLIVLITSGLLVNLWLTWKQQKRKSCYASLASIILIWIAGAMLSGIEWTKPFGKPFTVSLIQGNIPQELKWLEEHTQDTLNIYKKLTADHWDSKLIIWPEAAIPVPLQNIKYFIDEIATAALQHDTTIITGIPVRAPFKDGYYNAVITIGNGKGFYFKSHLVPFGEFTPLEQQLGKLLTFLDIPMSNMVTEKGTPPAIIVNHVRISAFICYEIAFPELVRPIHDSIGAILTVTDDAWFGHSIAQAQHLEIARMRALETGRPILFVSNDGMTAFISPHGAIQSAAPQYQTYVLTDTLQAMRGKTPWNRFNMDPVLCILGVLLFIGILGKKYSLK